MLSDLSVLGDHLDKLLLSAPVDVFSVVKNFRRLLDPGAQLGELLFKSRSDIFDQAESFADLSSLDRVEPLRRFFGLFRAKKLKRGPDMVEKDLLGRIIGV